MTEESMFARDTDRVAVGWPKGHKSDMSKNWMRRRMAQLRDKGTPGGPFSRDSSYVDADCNFACPIDRDRLWPTAKRSELSAMFKARNVSHQLQHDLMRKIVQIRRLETELIQSTKNQRTIQFIRLLPLLETRNHH